MSDKPAAPSHPIASATQPLASARELAAQVVGKFAHFESGIEWVTNPNPSKLRDCITRAIESFSAAARAEAEQKGRADMKELSAKECEAIAKANYTGGVDMRDDYGRRCLEIAARTIRSLPTTQNAEEETR